MKPFLKIIIILGVIILIGVGIYLAWRKITALNEETPGVPRPPVAVPPAESGSKLNQISEEKIFDFWIVKDTGEIFYITPTGKIMSAKNGPDLEISKQTLNALNFIEAGPDEKKILAAFDNPRAPNWGIFDLTDKAWRPLPSEILNITWGQTSDELVGVVKNNNELNLAKINISKTPPTYTILAKDFRFKDVRFVFKNPETLIISELPSAFVNSRAWQLDLKTLRLTALLLPEGGLTLKWLRGENLAFKFSPSNNLFFSGDPLLTKQMPANFITLPAKCGGQTLATSTGLFFCFVPQQLPTKITLPDDFFQNKLYTTDDLFLLTLNFDKKEISEIKNPLLSGVGDVPAVDGLNPQIAGDSIYFINRLNGYLYEYKTGR